MSPTSYLTAPPRTHTIAAPPRNGKVFLGWPTTLTNVCDPVEPPHPPSFLGHPLPRGERGVARWKDQNRSAGRQVRASVAVRLGGQAGCRPGDRAVRRTDPELARTADRRLHRVSVDRPYNGIAFRVIPDSHGCTKPPHPSRACGTPSPPGRGLNNF